MRALIVGGGIAGTATAMALHRTGADPVVFEAHPSSDADRGSYFTVTANGLAALESVGARHLAEAAGFTTRRNVLWNGDGRRLATLPLDSTIPGSPTARTLKRSGLVRVLQDESLRRGIPIEFERRLVGAEADAAGGVVARFADGSEARGDVLIGADGVHSVLRRIIDPASPAPRYVGLTNFGGVTRGAGGRTEGEAWHLVFGRRAFFGYHATPGGDVVWFANVPGPMITRAERGRTSEAAWRELLVDLFAGDRGPATDLIRAGTLELAADSTHDLPRVPVWHRGSLVIIGDAAHAPAPTAGQGASMAIEDGVVLARQLDAQPSVAAALAAFEHERRERVERIVAWGARGSSAKTPGPFGRVARDLALRLLFNVFVTQKSLSWMYDYRAVLGERTSPTSEAA